jgi:hypothetical protein
LNGDGNVTVSFLFELVWGILLSQLIQNHFAGHKFMAKASGTFEVKMTMQSAEAEQSVGRFLLEKEFQGDLQATSAGQMLAVSTNVDGSAGYVAMERVNGTLAGRSGSFALQHSGIMTRGTPQLIISVVPDSGTDELAGLSGTMDIQITDGKHFYEFDYTIAGTD